MKTLLSMVDFIEEIKDYVHESHNYDRAIDLIFEYSTFLKQPLTLGMFIPCDENGNVLEEPKFKDSKYIDNKLAGFKIEIFDNDLKKYNDATMIVLFKGFVWDGNCAINKEKLIYVDEETCLLNENIEAYVSNKLELTESAIKQITG